MRPPLLWLLIAALCPPRSPGQTYYGRNNYVEYRAGDLPLILTAPHGGTLAPAEIPDRAYGVTDLDTNTRELAIACSDEIYARTGHRPHLVLCHLRRTKLDANREIVEAAQGDAYAEQAWNEFHGFIDTARDAARSAHGFAHLIDLHGHGHAIDRLELGYGLGADELNLPDTALNKPGYAWMSTLRTLALSRPGVPFPTLLRGPRSLGDLFNLRGVPAWPSPDYPSPGAADFFDGGHIVRIHTCLLDNDAVRGVQIESHYAGVRDTAASRADFAARFANVLQPYLWDNYGYDIRTLSISRLETPAAGLVLSRGGPALTVTVRRTGYLGLSTTLPVALGGTAVRGSASDYVSSLSSTVFFAANASVASFTLTPTAAGPAFGDKTLTVTLAPTATQTADLAPLVLTLGDGVSQVVRVAAPVASAPESAGTVRFHLTRTRTAAGLTVPLAWSGAALPDADYHDAPASAVFPPGVAALDLDVPLVDDGRAAPDRALVLTVGPGSGFAAGRPAAAVTIRDDDRPSGLAVWLRGDLAGNVARDSSGADRHAATLPAAGDNATGPTQLTVAADAGEVPAIAFDGINDTVALPKLALDPYGAFTLAFFFRLDAGGSVGNQNLAAYGARSAAGSLHLYLATTNPANGTVALRANLPGFSGNALDVSRTPPSSWQDAVWRHYALSVAADGSARVYLDGALQRTATGRSGRLAADELLWLGWRPDTGSASGFMGGALRDIRVYQRALPAAEVASLASARLRFAAWLGQNSLPPSLAASADPDGDGLSAFLEYALAASPAVATAAPPRYEPGLDGGRLTLAFVRETAAADLAWQIEATNDLGSTWQPLARRAAADSAWTILTAGATVLEKNGRVVATDSAVLALQPRRFLRLRVESIP